MSVVVALKKHSMVYMGSDSLASNGSGAVWYNKDKVWLGKAGGRVLIGAVGLLSIIETVRHGHPFIPDIPTLHNVHEWLTTIRSLFKEEREYKFMIGGNNKLFLAHGDGLVVEVDKFEAIGSGRDLALGALEATRYLDLEPKATLDISIETSIKYDAFCGGKILQEHI